MLGGAPIPRRRNNGRDGQCCTGKEDSTEISPFRASTEKAQVAGGRARHALKCEKIVRVGNGQPSGDSEFLSYGCRILALFARVRFFLINELD